MLSWAFVIPLLMLLILIAPACAPPGSLGVGDLILINGKVWTGVPRQPSATAFVVKDGRYVMVGDDAQALSWRSPRTQVLDAGGAPVLPGLIDAHVHLIAGGQHLFRLNLRDVRNRSEFVAAIAERARSLDKGDWLLGGRWSTESWPDPAQPARSWIDAGTQDNPVLLYRMDGHGALANTAALRVAGIDRVGPPDPPGGRIERDVRTGEPTGILKESAIELVEQHVPMPSAADVHRALLAAMEEANRFGVTCVHTMSPWSDLAALDAARLADELTLRVRFYVSEDDGRDYLAPAATHQNDDWIRVVGFKQFADGSLGSRTAYMAQPYRDNPPDKARNRGLLTDVMTADDKLRQLCLAADAAGFSLAIHAIGDEANRLVLDIYDACILQNGPRDGRRLRVEHAQHLLPEDIARFGRLGVIASMQPLHKADDGRYAEKAIGLRRCRTSYAFRALLDAGAVVAFGSDWPVVTIDPFAGIQAAVTGAALDGRIFVAEQNIDALEALGCYTYRASYAAGDERSLGRIAPAYLADFVLLDHDLLGAHGAVLADARVRATFVNGKQVWPRASAP